MDFCVSPSRSQGPSSSGAAQLLFPLSAGSTRGRQTAKHEANRKPHWTLIYGKSLSKCLSQCCTIPWWLTVLRVYKLLHSPFLLKTKPCWLGWWPPALHFLSSAQKERNCSIICPFFACSFEFQVDYPIVSQDIEQLDEIWYANILQRQKKQNTFGTSTTKMWLSKIEW